MKQGLRRCRKQGVKHGFKARGAVCQSPAIPGGERAIILTMASFFVRPILACGLLLAGVAVAADRQSPGEGPPDRVERVRAPTAADVIEAERRRDDHWQDSADPRAGRFPVRAQQFDHGRQSSTDMQQAIEQAQSRHGGKVLSADRINYRGEDHFRVKLLTPDGRVRVVQLQQSDLAPDADPIARERVPLRRIDRTPGPGSRSAGERPVDAGRDRGRTDRRRDVPSENSPRHP